MLRSTGQHKAQASIEFMILIILFLVAISVAMIVSIHRSYTISQSQVDLSSTTILNSAANRINTAFLEGDGYSIKITLPENILRMDYTIEVNSNELIMRLDGRAYVASLLTDNVTGSFTKGVNTITNRNGEILING